MRALVGTAPFRIRRAADEGRGRVEREDVINVRLDKNLTVQVLAFCMAQRLLSGDCALVLKTVRAEATPPPGCVPERGRGCPGDTAPVSEAPAAAPAAVPPHLRRGAGRPCDGDDAPYVATHARYAFPVWRPLDMCISRMGAPCDMRI